MAMVMSLRRLMGRRNVRFGINNYKYNSNYNNNYYHIDNPLAISTTQVDSFSSFTNVGGLVHKSTENPTSMCSYQTIKERELQDSEDDMIIHKGDFVDLSQLLFTQDRGYLVKCNDHQLVMADQLLGKLVVIYFVPLHCHPDSEERYFTKTLTDTYNDLKPKNCFEVVLVVVDDFATSDGEFEDSSLQEKFQDIVSGCPSWLAIPFSDITSRTLLKRKFGFFDRLLDPELVHIDSNGIVLVSSLETLIQSFGSVAYPFEFEMIPGLIYEDKAALSFLSLKALLGSAERDFVITNQGDEVPITTLENKVVALFFYEDGFSPDFLTSKLKKYYAELKKNHEKFEVVLLYLSDTDQTRLSTNRDTFQETFKTMPWLALPFKDPALKKLKRFFDYPDEPYISEPTLVVVGPRRDTIESGAHTILSEHDDLFMHEKFAKVEGERVRELKLEMLCSPTTVFERRDGSQVQFSELVGKRIIFWFEGDYPEYDGSYFHEKLKERYIDMKGTDDEFEVIYFPNNKDENCERVADVPWLVVSCAVEKLPGCSAFLSFYGNCFNRYRSSYLLAFDRDGRLVRRTICPRYDDPKFPFNADFVDTEAFEISFTNFCWGYWDTLYQGLLKDSKKQINFPSGDLLCCVYFY